MNSFSVIIPTKDRMPILIKCLKILNKSSYFNFEVLIINDSLKKIKEIPVKTTFKLVVLNECKCKGPAYCRNIGVSKASSQYVVFIDDDCFVHKKWAEKIYKNVILKNISLCKGKVCFDGNVLMKKYLKFQRWGYNNTQDFGSTCNVILKKNIPLKYKFNTEFDFAFEDVDFFHRIKNIPTVKMNSIKVIHHGKTDLLKLLITYFRYGKGKYKYSLICKTEENDKKNFIEKYFIQYKQYYKNLKKINSATSMFVFILLNLFVLIDILKLTFYKSGYLYEKYKKESSFCNS